MDSITKAPTESEIREQFKLTRMGDEAKLLIGKWLHDYQQLTWRNPPNKLLFLKVAHDFGYAARTLREWRQNYQVSAGLRLPAPAPKPTPALPEPPPAIEGRALLADRTPVAPEPAYEEGATCGGEITRPGYTVKLPAHGGLLVDMDKQTGEYLASICECFLSRFPLSVIEAMYTEFHELAEFPEDTEKMWLHLKTQIPWRTQ
jgi:hypothetical protein